jgi:hypothetical protein
MQISMQVLALQKGTKQGSIAGKSMVVDKRQYIFYSILISVLLGLASYKAQGQNHPTYYLNKDKSHSLIFSGTFQTWLRFTEMNPGSLVNNQLRTGMVDLSLRRYRFNVQGIAADRLRYRLVVGENNVNYYTYRQFPISILEAYADYQVNRYLGIGIGKQGWTGLSRYAAPSASQPLALDIDFTAIPLVVVYDDILRRFGVYARGIVHRFDYRVSLSRPAFFPAATIQPRLEQATFADRRPLYQLSAYLKYQFFEHEPQITPWAAGTYLAKKRVLSLGAGMLHQPNTTWYLAGTDTIYHPVTSLAADLFYDQPLPGSRAVTFYTSYHYHNLGKNFIRNIGINNPANGSIPTTFINGPGNRVPIVGTGNHFFMQGAYLLPLTSKNTMQLQPYTSLAYVKLQGLDEPVTLYNIGFNYYLKGQKSKITFGYENRPVFERIGNKNLEAARRGMYVLQYQVQF